MADVLRRRPDPTPAQVLARGMLAGVVGTAAMTAWQLLSARLQSGGDEGDAAPPEPPQDPWEQASAPAKVARRIGEGVFQQDVSADLIPLLTNVMHWGYGIGWGGVYGLMAGGARRPRPGDGALFGTGVWVMSYVQLVPMGLYELPWKYAPKELAMDLSYHLAYGAGVGAGFAVLRGR